MKLIEKKSKKRIEKLVPSYDKVFTFLDICYNDNKKIWDYNFTEDEIWSIILSEDIIYHAIQIRRFNKRESH